MDKVICNHCKNELTIENIKCIKSTNAVTGLALVECKECGNVTEVSNTIAFEYKEYEQLQNMDKIYSFEDLDYLLNELNCTDKEKVKNCKFKVFEQSPDDDSGDVYYTITVFSNGTEIGNINMIYHSNTTWDFEINDEIKYGEPSYSYTMELNEQQTYNEEDYIECTKCHNKILGNYWLNVKKQGHYNYGNYEEDIYTGECPICGETIENSNLELYLNSIEAAETELQQYYNVIGNFGYDPFPFEDCDYSATCAAEDLVYIKNALESFTDMLSVNYLYNIDNVKAIQSNNAYRYNSGVITDIFHNTSYADFNINSVKDCEFKVLDCSVLNDIVEEDTFDTSTISILLQVIRNNKILGYIKVEQQYPLDKTFSMFEVKKDSNKRLVELCNAYTNMYNIKEDTPIMLSKSRTDEFNTIVCEKCGQIFCDCNLRCSICGKVFCEHKR